MEELCQAAEGSAAGNADNGEATAVDAAAGETTALAEDGESAAVERPAAIEAPPATGEHAEASAAAEEPGEAIASQSQQRQARQYDID